MGKNRKQKAQCRRSRWAAILLLLALCLAPAVGAQELPEEPLYLRVGLYWGADALEGANLLNEKGSGYDLGYFDETRQFVPLAHTEEQAISMLKDWSLRYVGGQYVSGSDSGPVVGCYHIRLSACDSYEAAAELAAGYADGYPAYVEGDWYACAGSYLSLEQAEAGLLERGLTGTAVTGSDRCVTVVATENQRVLFQFDCQERSLGVMPCASEAGQAPTTWFRGRLYYGGFQYTRSTGVDLTVVNFVSMADYLCGVVAYEMNPAWPAEALKAQTVAAACFAMTHLGAHASGGFDVCGTVCCQTYLGVWQHGGAYEEAVREVSAVRMTCGGEYVNAVYFSSDGGATEDSENVFYEALPYLRGKADPFEGQVNTGYDTWEMRYTAQQITQILQGKGCACGPIVSITPTYTALGNIRSLRFTDQYGMSWDFSRDKAGSILYSSRYSLSTKSQRFTVNAEGGSELGSFYVNDGRTPLTAPDTACIMSASGTASLHSTGTVSVLSGAGLQERSYAGSGVTISAPSYRLTGSGFGHNLGMSQYGAKAMAELGYTYREILEFYYTGVDIG